MGEKEVIQGLSISGILVQNGGRLIRGSSWTDNDVCLFFSPKQGVHDHITGGTVFLFLPWPMIIKRSLVWTFMCREAVSYSTGELKAQLEGPGSYHEMDISSVTCSTPIIRSLLSLPLYVGGMEKCGDTKHRKPACACLSVHLVQTGEKVLVQFYLLCGV